jgi:hypothetical protein
VRVAALHTATSGAASHRCHRPPAAAPAARFDVILVDAPWEECVRRAPGFVPQGTEAWTWREIQALAVDAIADTPSFVFL